MLSRMTTTADTAPRFVAYFRVSTAKQGGHGLGMGAQREIVARFVEQSQGVVVAEFVEVESGKRNDRPQLAAALATAKKYGATLLVGKLDRLARNVGFVARLIESGANFKAADCPNADKTMLQMLSVMAEWERDQISKRTSAALQEAKKRGVKLGTTIRDNNGMGRVTQATAAARRAESLAGVVLPLHSKGMSMAGIARTLTERQISTPRGGSWTAVQVSRLLKRIVR